MKLAIQKHLKDFIAILAIATIGILVAGYILSNQRFYLPSWVPLVGSTFVDYNIELETAQAVTPGQGQTVLIAGVPVGEIGQVHLKDGRAVVSVKMQKKYTPIYKNATALLRPKTGLQDMVIELDPGTKAGGEIPAGGTLPVSQTKPGVNPDQFLEGLDVDTRAYLRLLVAGAGQGLKGNSANLSATLKRFDPTARSLALIGKELGTRSKNIRRSIHNFRLLADALGQKDTQLASFVDNSNRVFHSFASQEASLREALGLLPTALASTDAALAKSETLSNELGPTLGELTPTAKGLAPALKSFQSFAKDTQPVIENQLTPFVKQAQPVATALEPAAADLASAVPNLDSSLSTLNVLFNELAYNPTSGATKGKGYLYWLGWLNHAGASIFGSEDANGPTRRGLVYGSCASLATLERIGSVNPVLGTLAALLNAPSTASVCPQLSATGAKAASAKAASAKASPAATPAGLSATPPATGANATPAKAAGR